MASLTNAATPGSDFSPAPSPAESSGSIFCAAADFDQGRRSSIRHIVPRSPPRPHDAATLSVNTHANGPSQSGGGPTSMIHSIPPRPKPGRKPATAEPETKRKAQNRISQRNFRERKQKNVQMLSEQVREASLQFKDAHSKWLREKQALEEQLRIKEQEIRILQDRVRTSDAQSFMWKDMYQKVKGGEDVSTPDTEDLLPMQSFVQYRSARHDEPLEGTQSGCDRCTPEHCACLADLTNDMQLPDEASARMDGVSMTGILRGGQGEFDQEKHPHVEFEVDFTNKFKSAASYGQQQPTTFAPSTEDNKITDCGFCEGQKDICICDPPARVDSADEGVSLTRMKSGSSAEEAKPNMALTGPGSCADCQSNPQQRAWCQRVAQLRSEETPSSSRRNSSKSSSLDIMEPKASTSIDMSAGISSPVGTGRTVGCSDAFKLLDGRVSTDPNAMDWRQLKPVPQAFGRQDTRRDTFTMEPGMYSAMELDASSILTTLQHAQRPLRPRPSDGPHAPLIEEAEERRRASFSPMTKADDHAMMDAVSHYNIGH
ncbi:hypothetical protein BKA58DRAFT_371890 [Alternaria rosae]|uniref:uncharacterized protein n=1 Tax=Alternaria rosae TaxID=1187941 RepID=UPI001E8D7072|nr:uncharacterized protein BKA58DRAFT_371890 [Alternaria rosae]KAH6881627.1 hypothetical protein BKA58DRAFT_371890 [Alternaria rosae]